MIPPTGITLRRALTLAGSLQQVRVSEGITRIVPTDTLQTLRDQAIEQGRLEAIENRLQTNGTATQEQISKAKAERQAAEAKVNETKALPVLAQAEQVDLRNLANAAAFFGNNKENLSVAADNATQKRLEQAMNKWNQDVTTYLTLISTKLAGTSAPVMTESAQALVALQRDSSLSTHYFPYDLCATGLAGEIRLEPDDLVQVIDVRRTSLNTIGDTDKRDMIVTGFARNLGRIDRQDTSVTVLNNVVKLAIPEYGVSTESVMVIVRDAANGIGDDVFVLPTNLLTSQPLSVSPSRGGDIYYFTPLSQVPAVFDGLVQSVVQTATPTPFVRDGQASAEHCGEKYGKLNSCPMTKQFLQDCRALKVTLETRFPTAVP
ncbi:MAG: hypothetical protein QM775_08690 [Pirellulales bacterium]